MVLAKEYRIPLPLSLEEYRIAQLYMIQKKSRLESTGEGSRVEILKNVPYENGPGGSGQYTKKIYHIGSHIPGWLKSFLPKTALRVEEEAWNAYPYTKTRTTCPFVDKFYIDVETYYHSDAGLLENVFNLPPAERASIPVDLIDPVKDPFPSSYYKAAEDPKKFVSSKSKRGPLHEDWLYEHINNASEQEIMCAYKLIKVEFKYWGIQSKIEQYIQDSARKTVLVAHRQAWSWQDEWCHLTINDIRSLEEDLQQDLSTKGSNEVQQRKSETREDADKPETTNRLSIAELTLFKESPKELKRRSNQSTEEIILGLRMTSIEEGSDSSYETPDSDDEFVDALEDLKDSVKDLNPPASVDSSDELLSSNSYYPQPLHDTASMNYQERCCAREATPTSMESPSSSVLLLVFHGGGVADVDIDSYPKIRDFKTFQSVFTSVASLLYPSARQSVALRLVECPSMCPQIVENLRKISVFAEEKASSSDLGGLPPTFPLSCIPLLLVSSLEFYQGVEYVINEGNAIYRKFLESSANEKEEIKVCILADCVGALLVYGALCSQGNRSGDISTDSLIVNCGFDNLSDKASLGSAPHKLATCQRSSSIDSAALSQVSLFKSSKQFDFDVSSFFCCGSPIGMILMKQYFESNGILPAKPFCEQVFNVFLPFDPVASRLEPLIEGSFSRAEPVRVPRYQSFPYSREILYSTRFSESHKWTSPDSRENPGTPTETMFNDEEEPDCLSESCSSGDTCIGNQAQMVKSENWWGSKRIDYMLYCPDGLQQFPFSALTQLCYSSYWESRDMAAFILWQILDENAAVQSDALSFDTTVFQPANPKEKWIKKRTSLKIKNMHPNHRANDIISLEGNTPLLNGKFVYGPIEVAALTGEKVDVYMSLHRQMENWKLLGSGFTNSHGRLSFSVPDNETVPQGIHAVKMVVRGDHSSIDCNLAVIPQGTEAVVFSIDGSFLAAYSLRAIDPKIRGGAVDVVRHWQELGYLIIYVTSRLLFQKHQVMGWLAQHNFPFGIVSFCESIRKDYQRHKQEFLRTLLKEGAVSIQAAYGSSRDIAIYTSLGLTKEQIFIVGKTKPNKHASDVQVITEGYAAHLSQLPLHALSRHATGQICSVLPWTCFGIPASGSKANTRNRAASMKFKMFNRKKSHQDKHQGEEPISASNESQVARCVASSSRLWPRR